MSYQPTPYSQPIVVGFEVVPSVSSLNAVQHEFSQTLDAPISLANSTLGLSGSIGMTPGAVITPSNNRLTIKALVLVCDDVKFNQMVFEQPVAEIGITPSVQPTNTWGASIADNFVYQPDVVETQFASYMYPLMMYSPRSVPAASANSTTAAYLTHPLWTYSLCGRYGLQGADTTYGSLCRNPSGAPWPSSTTEFMANMVTAQQPPVGDADGFVSDLQAVRGQKMWFIDSQAITTNSEALNWIVPIGYEQEGTPGTWLWETTGPLLLEYIKWVGIPPSVWSTLTAPQQAKFWTTADFGAGYPMKGSLWGPVNYAAQFGAPNPNYTTPIDAANISECPNRESKFNLYAKYYGPQQVGTQPYNNGTYLRNLNQYNTVVQPMNPNTFYTELGTGGMNILSGQTGPGGFIPMVSNMCVPKLLFVEGQAMYGAGTLGTNFEVDRCKPSDFMNSAGAKNWDKAMLMPTRYADTYLCHDDHPINRKLANYAAGAWLGNSTNLNPGFQDQNAGQGIELFNAKVKGPLPPCLVNTNLVYVSGSVYQGNGSIPDGNYIQGLKMWDPNTMTTDIRSITGFGSIPNACGYAMWDQFAACNGMPYFPEFAFTGCVTRNDKLLENNFNNPYKNLPDKTGHNLKCAAINTYWPCVHAGLSPPNAFFAFSGRYAIPNAVGWFHTGLWCGTGDTVFNGTNNWFNPQQGWTPPQGGITQYGICSRLSFWPFVVSAGWPLLALDAQPPRTDDNQLVSWLRNFPDNPPYNITNLVAGFDDTRGYVYYLTYEDMATYFQWGTGPMEGCDYTTVYNPTTAVGSAFPSVNVSGANVLPDPSIPLGGLGGYLNTLGDVVGTVNQFVFPPVYGVYPDLRAPSFTNTRAPNPYVCQPGSTSLVGCFAPSKTTNPLGDIHYSNDVNLPTEIELCYGQGWLNTYCQGFGSATAQGFYAPESKPFPPQAPFDTTQCGANFDLAHQVSAFRRFTALGNRRLITERRFADDPLIFPVNNSAASVMNPTLTDPIGTGAGNILRIGNTFLSLMNQDGTNVFVPDYPIPVQQCYYNAPHPLLEGRQNNRRDNYDYCTTSITNQPGLSNNFVQGTLSCQAMYGTCAWSKNHSPKPGYRGMNYMFPNYTDVLNVADQASDYTTVLEAGPNPLATYQFNPTQSMVTSSTGTYLSNRSFCNASTQVQALVEPTGFFMPKYNYQISAAFNGTSYADRFAWVNPNPVTAPNLPIFTGAPQALFNGPTYSHNFLQPQPEGYTVAGRFPCSQRMGVMFQQPDLQDTTTFTEPTIIEHTFIVPPGLYTPQELVTELNVQLNTPLPDGGYPFYRAFDLSLGKYVFSVCDYVDESIAAWNGPNNPALYPNALEVAAGITEGNQFGPRCDSKDSGLCFSFFAGNNSSRCYLGAADLEFTLNPEGNIVLSNTFTPYEVPPGLPQGSSLLAEVASILTLPNCTIRGALDPYQMGSLGQVIGTATTIDPEFFTNTIAVSPIDLICANRPNPFASNMFTGCGQWIPLTRYQAGLSSGLLTNVTVPTPSPTSSQVFNQIYTTEVVQSLGVTQLFPWLTTTPTAAVLSNPYKADATEWTVPGLQPTSYSWPLNPAALVYKNQYLSYFQQACSNSACGQVWNPWGATNVPGRTGIQILSIGIPTDATEVKFASILGLSVDKMNVFTPEVNYIKPVEGLIYNVRTKTYNFDKQAFAISNQSPELAYEYPTCAIFHYPVQAFNPASEADVEAFLVAKQANGYAINLVNPNISMERMEQQGFNPPYNRAASLGNTYNVTENNQSCPPANFETAAYNFTQTRLIPSSLEFKTNLPMFITTGMDFAGASALIVGQETDPLKFLKTVNPFQAHAYLPPAGTAVSSSYPYGSKCCRAVSPSSMITLPFLMGAPTAYLSNAFFQDKAISPLGFNFTMASLFGINLYNLHDSFPFVNTRSWTGSNFHRNVDCIANGKYLTQWTGTSTSTDTIGNMLPLYETIFSKRFALYQEPFFIAGTDMNAPTLAPASQQLQTLFDFDQAVPGDLRYYPDYPGNRPNTTIQGVSHAGEMPNGGVYPRSGFKLAFQGTGYELDITAESRPTMVSLWGNGLITFPPTEEYMVEGHLMRCDDGIPTNDADFHGDLLSTTDPNRSRACARGPLPSYRGFLNAWTGSAQARTGSHHHLIYPGYTINFPATTEMPASNLTYGDVNWDFPKAQVQGGANNIVPSLTHMYGEIDAIINYMSQTSLVVPMYDSKTYKVSGYEVYKQGAFENQKLLSDLKTYAGTSGFWKKATPDTTFSVPTNYDALVDTKNGLSWLDQTSLYDDSTTTLYQQESLAVAADCYYSWVSNTGTHTQATNLVHELSLVALTENVGLYTKEDADIGYEVTPNNALAKLLCGSTGKGGIQLPLAGRIRCDCIAQVALNSCPNTTYLGVSSMPTVAELQKQQYSPAYEPVIELLASGEFAQTFGLVTNLSISNATYTFGPVFPETQPASQSQIVNGIARPTIQYTTTLGSNIPTNPIIQDLSDPTQTTTWANNFFTFNDPVVAAQISGLFYLQLYATSFAIAGLSNMNGRTSTGVLCAIEGTVSNNVSNWSCTTPFEIAANSLDRFTISVTDVKGQPIRGLQLFRIFLTFTPTHQLTPAEQAFTQNIPVQQVYQMGGGQSSANFTGGTLLNSFESTPLVQPFSMQPHALGFGQGHGPLSGGSSSSSTSASTSAANAIGQKSIQPSLFSAPMKRTAHTREVDEESAPLSTPILVHHVPNAVAAPSSSLYPSTSGVPVVNPSKSGAPTVKKAKKETAPPPVAEVADPEVVYRKQQLDLAKRLADATNKAAPYVEAAKAYTRLGTLGHDVNYANVAERIAAGNKGKALLKAHKEAADAILRLIYSNGDAGSFQSQLSPEHQKAFEASADFKPTNPEYEKAYNILPAYLNHYIQNTPAAKNFLPSDTSETLFDQIAQPDLIHQVGVASPSLADKQHARSEVTALQGYLYQGKPLPAAAVIPAEQEAAFGPKPVVNVPKPVEAKNNDSGLNVTPIAQVAVRPATPVTQKKAAPPTPLPEYSFLKPSAAGELTVNQLRVTKILQTLQTAGYAFPEANAQDLFTKYEAAVKKGITERDQFEAELLRVVQHRLILFGVTPQ